MKGDVMVFNIKRVFIAMICAVFIFGFSITTNVTANDDAADDGITLSSSDKLVLLISPDTGEAEVGAIGNAKRKEKPGNLRYKDGDIIIHKTVDQACTCYNIDLGGGMIVTMCFGDTCPN